MGARMRKISGAGLFLVFLLGLDILANGAYRVSVEVGPP